MAVGLPWSDRKPDRGRTIFSRPGEAKTYEDLPHGMPTTHAEIVNAELVTFLKA